MTSTPGAHHDDTDAVRDLGHGIYQLATDYPEVCNAPLWSYALLESERFALIDPGIRSTLGSRLVPALRELGLPPESAELVVATHGHPDHSGGQSSWEEVSPDAKIAAPLAEVPWVESFTQQWVQFWDDYPGTLDLRADRAGLESLCVPEPKVTVLLRDGDVFGIGERQLTVIETRGHTWGHCAYLDGASGALFTGDAAQGRGTPSSDGDSVFAPLYLDVEEARFGLRRLLDVPFTMLCPAHFSPMDRDAGRSFLLKSLAFIDEAEAITRALVDERGLSTLTTGELAERIGETVGTRPPRSPQTVATARAHLYALAREGLLEAAWIPVSRSSHDHNEEGE